VGTGCGWAFQSAEWLADAVACALQSGGVGEVDVGAHSYQRKHRHRFTLSPV
jgi:hypothetical protein